MEKKPVGMPLDNPGGVAMRAGIETNAARTEPVVELVRKKLAVAEGIEEHAGGHGSNGRKYFRPSLTDLPKVQLPRGAAAPLVTSSTGYAKEAIENYKSLRARLLKWQATKGMSSVAITSVGRAEGKTLTAFNLACCCASPDNSVLLIDGDLRNRSLTRLIGGMPPFGLADVISGAASQEEAIAKTDVANLYVMGSGKSDETSADLFSSERWSELVHWAVQHFKLVLIDAMSLGAFADFDLVAPECDGVLLVVRARTTSREVLKTALEQVDVNKLVGVVWNGFEP